MHGLPTPRHVPTVHAHADIFSKQPNEQVQEVATDDQWDAFVREAGFLSRYFALPANAWLLEALGDDMWDAGG